MLFNLRTYVAIIFIVPNFLFSDELLENWFNNMSSNFIEIVERQDNTNLQNELNTFIKDNFAVNSISLSLIGKIAKNSTENDLKLYKEAFERHLTKSLYNLVERYNGQQIKLIKIKKDSNGSLIYSELSYNEKIYNIVWRVVEINNKYYVLDLIIENTSYYVTKKSEFSNLLRKNKGSLKELTKIIDTTLFN